jgi:predicted N-acyltransferase
MTTYDENLLRILSLKDSKLLNNLIEKAIISYCKKNKIITEFQRFNPILENQNLFLKVKDKHVFFDREIVYVDLNNSQEDIWLGYNRHTRKNIKKAKREGLSVFRSVNPEKDLKDFIKIYQSSMKIKDANDFYFFNEKFFNNLIDWFKKEISIFFVEYKGETITASLELGKYGILHDYLRGSNPEYDQLRPTELLLDEIINWAKGNEFNAFVIGGGKTNSDDDDLLRFKKKISNNVKEYYLYKKIHDMEIYKNICRDIGLIDDLKFEKAQYFPECRDKDHVL